MLIIEFNIEKPTEILTNQSTYYIWMVASVAKLNTPLVIYCSSGRVIGWSKISSEQKLIDLGWLEPATTFSWSEHHGAVISFNHPHESYKVVMSFNKFVF